MRPVKGQNLQVVSWHATHVMPTSAALPMPQAAAVSGVLQRTLGWGVQVGAASWVGPWLGAWAKRRSTGTIGAA